MNASFLCAIYFIFELSSCIYAQCIRRHQQFERYLIEADRKCLACKPGEYVHTYCSTNRTNKCVRCPPQYFMDLWNTCRICHTCFICPRHWTENSPCTSTSDRTCKCINGFYKKGRKCLRYQKCPPGHGVTGAGTSIKDVKCSKCLTGYFQPKSSSTARCQPHTVCKHGVHRKGSRTEDNLCIIPVTYRVEETESSPTYSSTFDATSDQTSTAQHLIHFQSNTDLITPSLNFASTDNKTEQDYNWKLVFSLVGIFGTIICLLCAMIAIYFFCKKENETNDTTDERKEDISLLSNASYDFKDGTAWTNVFWYLKKKIPIVNRHEFFSNQLNLEENEIDDIESRVTIRGEAQSDTIFYALQKWSQINGEHATLEGLLNMLESMNMASTKHELIDKFFRMK